MQVDHVTRCTEGLVTSPTASTAKANHKRCRGARMQAARATRHLGQCAALVALPEMTFSTLSSSPHRLPTSLGVGP